MRFRVLIALFIGSTSAVFGASPEAKYWADRAQAVERLQTLEKSKTDASEISTVESVALTMLESELARIVGPIRIEGLSAKPESHIASLRRGPDYNVLDGLSFREEGRPGAGLAVTVTTEPLLSHWLRDQFKINHQEWAQSTKSALQADKFYGDALNPKVGFNSIVDLKLAKPGKGSLAFAKLGRFGARESAPRLALVVTVVKGSKVLIATAEPQAMFVEAPPCKAKGDAAQRDANAADEEGLNPADSAWFSCEREIFPTTAAYPQMQREAQQLAERLAKAK